MASTAAAQPQLKKTGSTGFLSRLRGGDEVARLITLLFATSVLIVTALLITELWVSSGPSREKFGFSFLTSTTWNPVTDEFGAWPFLYGTIVTSVVALLISVPIGVGAAIYLAELAGGAWSDALTFLVELLASVPSVIYGLLAIFTIVPMMREFIGPALKTVFGSVPLVQNLVAGPVYGVGYLTASIVLAIMIFPYIISVSREALLAVPREQREAALALGATKWESTWQIVVPFARLGIIGSVFLGFARALGETMAVTMVIGNDNNIHASLLSPGNTIPAILASEFNEASGKLHPSALIELGLVLFLLTLILNGLARLLILVTTRKGSARA
jgi:phosphate transport system permease protein